MSAELYLSFYFGGLHTNWNIYFVLTNNKILVRNGKLCGCVVSAIGVIEILIYYNDVKWMIHESALIVVFGLSIAALVLSCLNITERSWPSSESVVFLLSG